jgi:hypothetical protein
VLGGLLDLAARKLVHDPAGRFREPADRPELLDLPPAR